MKATPRKEKVLEKTPPKMQEVMNDMPKPEAFDAMPEPEPKEDMVEDDKED